MNNSSTAQDIYAHGPMPVDWTKFGLSETPSFQEGKADVEVNDAFANGRTSRVKELFEVEQEITPNDQPWWKTSFFVRKRVLFGTWDGVFTSCVMNIVGVVIFLRAGWLVAYAGIGLSVLIILLAFAVALSTLMSAVGICHKCDVGKGDVYLIITHVLGGKMGGTIGLLYCIGNSVATSLYCIGFAESLVETVNWNFSWAVRIISMITLLVLLCIAILGVKWIVRFQLLLLVVLCVAILDFIIGTLATEKPAYGFTGFSNRNFFSNLHPQFTSETTFFVVLGVFFPSAFGVMAGVSMSGDLKNPKTNVPEGSLASLGACGALYIVIVLFLGSTCTNQALKTDYMIMEKVSLVGALFLFGLFVASLSSSLGGLVGPPKVFQCISEENVLPALKPFAKTRGVTEEPLNATIFMTIISLLVLFVGKLNTIAPIVVMPFLMTYAVINYAYFAMEMSFDINARKSLRMKPSEGKGSYGALQRAGASGMRQAPSSPIKCVSFVDERGGAGMVARDCDEAPLLDESHHLTDDRCGLDAVQSGATSQAPAVELRDVTEEPSKWSAYGTGRELEPKEAFHKIRDFRRQSSVQLPFSQEMSPMMYAKLCNRWIALCMSFLCVLLSFCIDWVYALANLCITLILYVLINQSRPGLPSGISSEFVFTSWLVSPWRQLRRSRPSELVVIHSSAVPYGITMYQVTQQNTDYDHRDRKHHASPITEGRQPYQ